MSSNGDNVNDLSRVHRGPPGKPPSANGNGSRIGLFETIRRTHQLRMALLEDTLREEWNGTLNDLYDFGGSDLFWSLQGPSGGIGYPPANPGDRRHGRNWPFWVAEPQLNRLRQRSRILCTANSNTVGLLLNRTNYTIGKGFSYNAVPKKNRKRKGKPDDALLDLADRVQEVIDEFLARNQWNSAVDHTTASVVASNGEREAYRRRARDGEAFIRFYFEDNGRTTVCYLEPERIRNPGDASDGDGSGWYYGRRHQMEPYEDAKKVLELHAVWADPQTGQRELEAEKTALGEIIPEGCFLHLLGPDTDSTIARGIPDFSYGTADALERASKLQKAISIAAAIHAAVAETWQVANATGAQVAAFAGGMGVSDMGPPGMSNPQQPSRYQDMENGTIRYGPEGFNLVPQPADASTAPGMEAVQGDLRQACAAFGAPEYWTASTENGNYSNLMEASAPAVKQGENEQEYFRTAFGTVIWKAVHHAINSGLLPSNTAKLIDIQVEASAVRPQNELEKAQKDQILFTMKAKSPQTIAMEDGLDPDVEAANFQEAEQAAGGPGGQNNPLAMPPEEDDPTQPPGGPPKPPGGLPPKPKPTPEGKDASGHEHGDDGKFGSGGGGSKGKTAKKEKAAVPDKSLHLHGADIAKEAHQELNAVVRGEHKGRYNRADAAEDIGLATSKAKDANDHNFQSRYDDWKSHAAATYGKDSLASPEWQDVKKQFGQYKSLTGKTIDRMGSEANAYNGSTKDRLKAVDTLHNKLVQHNDDAVSDIGAALQAFVDKHGKKQESAESKALAGRLILEGWLGVDP